MAERCLPLRFYNYIRHLYSLFKLFKNNNICLVALQLLEAIFKASIQLTKLAQTRPFRPQNILYSWSNNKLSSWEFWIFVKFFTFSVLTHLPNLTHHARIVFCLLFGKLVFAKNMQLFKQSFFFAWNIYFVFKDLIEWWN